MKKVLLFILISFCIFSNEEFIEINDKNLEKYIKTALGIKGAFL